MTVRELIEQLNGVPQNRQDQEVEVHEGENQPGEASASSFRRYLPQSVTVSATEQRVILIVRHAEYPHPPRVSNG